MIIDNQKLTEEQYKHFNILADKFFMVIIYEDFGQDKRPKLGLFDVKEPTQSPFCEEDILKFLSLKDNDINSNYIRWLYYNLKEFLQKRWNEVKNLQPETDFAVSNEMSFIND